MTATWWTKEEYEGLLRLTPLGWSASEIGKTIGKSRNAVIGKWNRSGIRVEAAALAPDTFTTIVRKERARTAKKAYEIRTGRRSRPERTDPFRPRRPEIIHRFVEQPALISRNPRPLLELEADECRFAISSHGTRNHIFCGNPALWPRFSYCEGHCFMAYRRERPRDDLARIAKAAGGFRIPQMWCAT